jgi:hypothetical protein
MKSILLAMCAVLTTGTAGAQTLNLNGATQTVQIDSAHPPHLRTGEPVWWPTPLPARSLADVRVSYTPGLDPSGSYVASGQGGSEVSWSSWSGETEAYPNKNALTNLRASGVSLPLTQNTSMIDLIARPMPAAVAATLPSQLSGKTILSGAFNSYPYSQEYGYFEMTAKVPKGDGLWPAFWLRPVDYKSGEIDIMEILSKDTTVTYASIHTDDAAWNAAYKTTFWYKTIDLSLAYHRYGVDWEANTITFYLDGVAIETVPTPSDMHKPYFILANLAVGGTSSWSGPIDSTTVFPAVFSIESIKVYKMPS